MIVVRAVHHIAREIFGVIAADEFLFGFNEIEWRTIEFRLARKQEDNKRHKPSCNEVPVRNEATPTAAGLSGRRAPYNLYSQSNLES